MSLSDLPVLRQAQTASQQEGDRVAHNMLSRRLDKYALRLERVTDDGTNLLRAIQQSNHGLAHLSIAEWRKMLCGLMEASGDETLSPMLPQWRQKGDLDHCCLPYAATAMECVVMVWPARMQQSPHIYLPQQHLIDTPIVCLQWTNRDGAGDLTSFHPLVPRHPLLYQDLRAMVRAKITAGITKAALTATPLSGSAFHPDTL